MITIKLPYNASQSDNALIIQYQKSYSSLLRSIYNQKKNGFSDIDIRLYVKLLSNNLKELNCWFTESALYDAKTLLKSSKDNVIFGSKKQFIRRCKNLISNEEYKESRLLPIYSVGQKKETGNRLFRLNILNDKQIIFKPKFGTKIVLNLPKLKQGYFKQLSKLEELSKAKEVPFTVKLDKDFIYISFEEFKLETEVKLLNNRYLAIDLNPNHIGLSVNEYKNNKHKILHTIDYDLTELIKNNNTNKIKFETLELSKTIINICKHYQCKFLFMEELSMLGKNHEKGKKLNKLINNNWFRNLITNNLKKRANINNINLYLVNPAYSSYIGNLQNDYSDPINSSIEIGRRGYEVFILKIKDSFYPKIELKQSILHLWKEMDIDIFKSWIELCKYIKNSKMRYRVPMNEVLEKGFHKVYRQEYNKPRGLYASICV
jgi:IS605 OrfB family transposase